MSQTHTQVIWADQLDFVFGKRGSAEISQPKDANNPK